MITKAAGRGTPVRQNKEAHMKKINVAALLTAGAIAIFGLAGCGSKVTSIEVNQYGEVEYEGYDSVGQITKSEFDARKLLNDNEKPL